MQRIAVRQKERKYLFLNKNFTPGIPKEPNLGLLTAVGVSQPCRFR
jgi:hypothetical protein